MSDPSSDHRHTSAHARTPSEKRGPLARPVSAPYVPSLPGNLSPPPLPEKRRSWLFGGGRQRKSRLDASTPTPAPVLEDEDDQVLTQPMRHTIEPTPEADLPEWMALAQHAITRGKLPYTRYRFLVERQNASRRSPRGIDDDDDDSDNDERPGTRTSALLVEPLGASRIPGDRRSTSPNVRRSQASDTLALETPRPTQHRLHDSVFEDDDHRPVAKAVHVRKLSVRQRIGALRCGGQKIGTYLGT